MRQPTLAGMKELLTFSIDFPPLKLTNYLAGTTPKLTMETMQDLGKVLQWETSTVMVMTI